ncbi:MAG: PAS domain-containing protein, partial [Desulfohalobiaceae bacterium]|nr:PAS domain-containing protein [Desulfohalobiaceae bacterium]
MEPVTFASSEDVNIAIVGGGKFTAEVLEKTTPGSTQEKIKTRIVAVVDRDESAPGMVRAKELGCYTFRDYRVLFQPEYNIGLIIVLDPDSSLFEEIRVSKPRDIRILALHTFKLFWDSLNHQIELLQQRNLEIETILNGIQDSILVLNQDMCIVEVNQAFLESMGYTREEVIQRKCYQVLQDRNYKCNGHMLCPVDEVLSTGQAVQRVVPRVNRQGSVVYIEVSLYPITEADGSVNRLVEISRDVTRLAREDEEINRRLEELLEERTRELQKRNIEIQHQDKMASLGKLSAAVVHEINNPLSGILNLLLLIKRITQEGPVDEKTTAQFTRYVELMEQETRRISGITSNLLAFSRESQGEFGQLDLNQLLEDVLFLNANLLRLNEVRVVREYAQDLPLIGADGEQLKQVFMNLITNAVEAMESSESKVLRVGTTYGEHTVRASVEDTGPGIPVQQQSQLFEPFFSTKSIGKGVGLG